ncbi:hypothetical protein [Microbacterium terrisoli]|jgi:hypothetical protein|uniref:hypothetical protein n=1 Tax=Microbacterium terrisoli TaxID=3242192 RepID=UPI0028040219|nr:hypothetical protein [Microbacterium protaetiae]
MDEKERSEVPVGLPIACSLPLAEGGRRVARWQALAEDHLIERRRTEGALTLRYERDDDAITRLTDLTDAERECCSYVGWTVEPGDNDVRLLVTGTEDALDSLLFLDPERLTGVTP